MTIDNRDWIAAYVELRDLGMTIPQAADELGVTANQLRNHIQTGRRNGDERLGIGAKQARSLTRERSHRYRATKADRNTDAELATVRRLVQRRPGLTAAERQQLLSMILGDPGDTATPTPERQTA